MKKNKEHLFSTIGCLSLEAIIRYLNEQSSSREMHMVEKHMLECELCKEAVEGYALMEGKEKAPGIILEINKGIKATDDYRFGYRRIAAGIAAVFVLGGGLYYLSANLNSVNDSVAEQREEAPKELLRPQPSAAPEVKDSKEIIAIDGNQQKVSGEVKVQEFLPPTLMEDEKVISKEEFLENSPEENQTWVPEVGKKMEESSTFLKSADTDAVPLKETTVGNVTEAIISSPAEDVNQQLNKVIISKNKENQSNVKKKSRAVEKEPAPASNYKLDVADAEEPQARKKSLTEKAMDNYNEKRYSEASILFEQVLKTAPSNSKVLYYNGLSYLESSKLDKAIENFNQIKQGQEFYEDARWSKAIALIKKGDKNNAKILLKEISERENPYKQKALDELKKIE